MCYVIYIVYKKNYFYITYTYRGIPSAEYACERLPRGGGGGGNTLARPGQALKMLTEELYMWSIFVTPEEIGVRAGTDDPSVLSVCSMLKH